MDDYLRQVCQAIEKYDTQELIAYLAHESWTVITEKERIAIEKENTKEKKLLLLRKVIGKDRKRIERLTEVLRTFASNVHTELLAALSCVTEDAVKIGGNKILSKSNDHDYSRMHVNLKCYCCSCKCNTVRTKARNGYHVPGGSGSEQINCGSDSSGSPMECEFSQVFPVSQSLDHSALYYSWFVLITAQNNSS